MGMGSKPTTMMPIYSGSPQGGFGQQYGAGTYDPMLGFGQASGMGTTYNYPTRYSADYTRYAQSGQPFNQPVMGYNSYGQIFAQPQRPPPSMGKGGGGFRPPPPSFGGKGGGYDPNRRVGTNPLPTDPEEQRRRYNDPRTGQDATDRRLNRTGPPTMGGKGGPQPENDGVTISYPGGSRTVPRSPQRRSNQLGLTGRGPPGDNTDYRPVEESNFVGILPNGGLNNDVRFGPSNPYTDDLVMSPVRADRPVIDENIYNSPFRQLIGGGLGGMPKQTVDPYQGSYQISEIPYQGGPGPTDPREQMNYTPGGFALGRFDSNAPKPMPVNNGPIMSYPGGSRNWNRQFEGRPSYYNGSGTAQQTGGVFADNLNNPAYQQQMAFQQGNSEEATRNRIQRELNDAFTTGQRSGVPLSDLYRQQDELSNKLYGQYGLKPVQATTQGSGGGLGGMVAGRSQDPNLRVMGERNFDMQGFNPPPQSFNFGQGFGRMAFQEGGQVPPDANMEMMMAETAQPEMAGEYDRLIQMTMQAILGQVESPDEVIQMFIDEFGVDAFRQLRDAVLKQQVPGAQTEGMVDGNGGGMDDQVMGMIGNQRPVAVSPGEYIVPADVVSGLGDGSSQSGADILDELNQAVRMTRTGTTQQPRPLMETLQQ